MNDAENFKSFAILFAILMIPVSLVLEWRRKKRDPADLPFGLGYWQGLTASSGLAIASLYLVGNGPHSEEGNFLAVLSFGVGLIGVFMLRRQKWAWILGTILTLNPLLWIINWFYIPKRWGQTSLRRLPSKRMDETDLKELTVGASIPTDRHIFLIHGDQQSGPFAHGQIKSMWEKGLVTSDTSYWYEGLSEWRPIREIV